MTLWLFFGILAALTGLAFIVRGVSRVTHRVPARHPYRREHDDER
ncbi:MAG: hypothetical protein ACO1PB_13630 [Ramlibacter sp.]